jgi:hypothetical protein
MWMVAGGLFGLCVWFGQLFEWLRGLALWPLEKSLQPEAPFRVSFYVVFCRCSFELTNGRRQCWVLKAEGLENSNEGETKVANAIT